MKVPILTVKDDKGNIIEIPAIRGAKGDKGDPGERGEPGTGVSVKSSADQCVAVGDAYIDADGNLQILTALPYTFTNGGQIKGPKGDKGDPGSPGAAGSDGVSVTHSWNGTVLNVTSASGTSSADLKGPKGDKGDPGSPGAAGSDGVSVTHTWNGTVLNVTSASGTSSADLKGPKGDKGDPGSPGAAGSDGVSVTHTWNGTVLNVTSASGTSSADLKGQKGDPGNPGAAGSDGVSVTHSWDGTVLNVTSASGTSSADLKGDKGDRGEQGFPGSDGVSATHSWNGTVLNVTSASGTSSSDLQGPRGPEGVQGERGTGILKTTSAPSSYTTAIGGYTPKYRISLSTIKTQAKVNVVLLGDIIQYSYYLYQIDYMDSSYAYISATRTSIRGVAGADGEKGDPGDDYVLTDADKQEIAEIAGDMLDKGAFATKEQAEELEEQIGELDERLAEHYVSVKEYGAKGDGRTNDTVAIQTALAENRVVYVQGGTYVLSGTLTVDENSTLILEQDTVLKFTQTNANCITLLRLASIRGNHATIIVPYAFNANVINCNTDDDQAQLDENNLANSNNVAVPPFTKWDPQWKMSRYVYDVNICKPNSNGNFYSDDGKCYGTGVFMGCYEGGICDFMWGVTMSGVRIAGGFTYGIHLLCTGDAWNHDARIEAVMDACETGVLVENTNFARLAVTCQCRKAKNDAKYAKNGVKLVNSRGIDMTSSRIWDWNENNSLWADGNEYQHIAMYGQCKGLVLDDFLYNEHSATDIRSTIYTDTQSNLETLIVLQEPITRWFKVKGNEPYYFNGYADNKLLTQAVFDDHFKTSVVKNFTDVLATADDGNGNIYNGIGYKRGVYANTNGSSIVESSFFVTTGYIPVKKGQKLVMRDLTFANAEGECRVIMFDSARKYILHVNSANFLPGTNWHIGYAGTEDGCTMTINSVVANDNVAFVRLVFYRTDVGAEPMIAVNEEIKFQYEGFLGDGIKVKGASVLLTSPSGKTFRLKVSDSGELGTE